MGVITPVPKPKGDLHAMDNYRAITVGSAISKIFAQVIRGRLDVWAENGGWRAQTQFGFRKGLGTAEAVFMLRHLVEKAQSGKKALCAAFIDFKKAYDSVPRELLWKCLERMGVHGEMFEILQQMYRNVKLQVKVDDMYGPEFESVIGVKQGDPLSPLLFGLFIDKFVTFLQKRCPESDIFCDDVTVQAILYADDMVLLSHDPTLLQKYLDILEVFCEATGMNVNVGKSEIVVFSKHFLNPAWNAGWTFSRKRVTESLEFVYLGVVFHSKGIKSSISKAMKRRANKAKSALFVKMGICHGMKIYDPKVLNKLFDGVVVPAALYGSEIWGPDAVNMAKEGLINQTLEDIQWLFLRMALWLGKATPHMCMLKEMGRDLLILKCIENTIGFWNKLATRPTNCVLGKAAKENILHVEQGWCNSIISMAKKVATLDATMLNEDGQLVPLRKKDIVHKFVSSLEAENIRKMDHISDAILGNGDGSAVRNCPDHIRGGFKQFKYTKWYAPSKDGGDDDPVIFHIGDVYNIRILSRFRCGMHWLATEKDRAEGGRSCRRCHCCTSGEREDEMHLLFCDAYESIRTDLPRVFMSEDYVNLRSSYIQNDSMIDALMNVFMNNRNGAFLSDFVGYLRRSVKIRDNILGNRLVTD